MRKLKEILKKKEINDLDLDTLEDIPQVLKVEYLKPGDEKYKNANQVLITILGKNKTYSRIKNYVKSNPLIEKLEINGIISTEDKNFDIDKFTIEFFKFLESKKVYFGGGMNDL